MYGLGLLVASGVAVIPDLARIVRIVMRALFYLSPVLYSITQIPEFIQPFASVNPMVAILGLYRVGFWSAEIETAWHYALSFGVIIMIIVIGFLVFKRLESRILKGS
jgi:ABC-2 type transport system permease protein